MSVLFGWSVTDVINFMQLCARLKEAFGQGRGGEMFSIENLRNHVRVFEQQLLQLRQILGEEEQKLSVDPAFVYSALFSCLSYVDQLPTRRNFAGAAALVAYRKVEMEQLTANLDGIRQALILDVAMLLKMDSGFLVERERERQQHSHRTSEHPQTAPGVYQDPRPQIPRRDSDLDPLQGSYRDAPLNKGGFPPRAGGYSTSQTEFRSEEEEMNRRALEGKEKALGPYHPDTLTSVDNLARVLQDQGKYDAAEEMNRRALDGREKVLGSEHPDTLASVSNLVLLLRSQVKHKAAEEMNRRALDGREKVLGSEHSDTLTSVNNLALVLESQGKYEAAEEMNRRALEGMEKVLGPEHPDTLTSMANLASTYRNQGRWKEAEELEVLRVETRKRVLRQEHPDSSASSTNLAAVYSIQGRRWEAEALRKCDGGDDSDYGDSAPVLSSLSGPIKYDPQANSAISDCSSCAMASTKSPPEPLFDDIVVVSRSSPARQLTPPSARSREDARLGGQHT